MDPLEHALANVLVSDASSPYVQPSKQLASRTLMIYSLSLSLSLSQKYQGYLMEGWLWGHCFLKLAQANTQISLIKWYGAQGTTDAAVGSILSPVFCVIASNSFKAF